MDEKLNLALAKLTHGMEEASQRHLGFLMCVFELKDGELLITEGKHAASMIIVYSGALRVTVGQGKQRIELPEIKSGEWVGEISLLDPGPASANVRTCGATTILEFSHQALLAFIKKHPAGALHLLSSLARDLAGRLNRTSEGLVQLGRTGLELVAPAPTDEAGMITTMLQLLNRGGGVDNNPALAAQPGKAGAPSETRTLESLDFFKLLSPQQVEKLRVAMPVKEHRKGHVFWKAGSRIGDDRCAVIFILEGQVSVATETAQVSQVPVARVLQPGEIFGLVTFLNAKVHSATCRAATPVRAAVMTRSEFDKLSQSDIALASAFMYAIARQLARDVRACNNRLVTAITSGPATKTAK